MHLNFTCMSRKGGDNAYARTSRAVRFDHRTIGATLLPRRGGSPGDVVCMREGCCPEDQQRSRVVGLANRMGRSRMSLVCGPVVPSALIELR